MRVGHWLAPSGLTKTMALGAICDAGGDLEAARRAVASVDQGWTLDLEEVRVSSVRCLAASVVGSAWTRSKRWRLDTVKGLIEELDLTSRAREMMTDIYRHLFASESAVHGTSLDETELHETGIGGNLALLAAACAALAGLDLGGTTVGQVAVGSGSIDSPSHGLLPIPPPAVVHLLEGYEVTSGPIAGERVTPTSAAFIKATAKPGQLPTITLENVGRGANSAAGSDGFASLLVGVLP